MNNVVYFVYRTPQQFFNLSSYITISLSPLFYQLFLFNFYWATKTIAQF